MFTVIARAVGADDDGPAIEVRYGGIATLTPKWLAEVKAGLSAQYLNIFGEPAVSVVVVELPYSRTLDGDEGDANG